MQAALRSSTTSSSVRDRRSPDKVAQSSDAVSRTTPVAVAIVWVASIAIAAILIGAEAMRGRPGAVSQAATVSIAGVDHSRKTVTPPASDAPSTASLQARIVQALLVPLLGGDPAAGWAEPVAALDCSAAQVSVNGSPVQASMPVPKGIFRMRWQLRQCKPMGDGEQVTGTIDAMIVPDSSGYRAAMRPRGLAIDSPAGRVVLNEPFRGRVLVSR